MKTRAALDPFRRRWLQRGLIGLLAALGVWLLTPRHVNSALDSWVYDQLLVGSRQQVSDHITLVVVDNKSLEALGRWPWSRGTHAKLLQTLHQAQPRAIGMDILLAEAALDDAEGDAELARTIVEAAPVVLPVAAETSSVSGLLTEVRPLPLFADAAAELGHAEVVADHNNIPRYAYLEAGIAAHLRPALALALRNQGSDVRLPTPGLRNPEVGKASSPLLWVRDYQVMVPYADRLAFRQVSYVDVLEGRAGAEQFRGQWVLIGVTASGLAPNFSIPEGGGYKSLTGVEYHAQVLNALLQHTLITQMPFSYRVLTGVLLVGLTLLATLALRRKGVTWLAYGIGLVACPLLSFVLLHAGRLWVSPVAAFVTIVACLLFSLFWHLRRSQKHASSDALTDLANRRMFEQTLEREAENAERSGQPLSLLLVDIDHFKQYNDNYGHQAGDVLLQTVSRTLALWARRPRDLACRYGGDELALILPGSPVEHAQHVAESIIQSVRLQAIEHAHSPAAEYASLSIGVATFSPGKAGTRPSNLLAHADAALYQAKRAGRNRARVWSPDSRAL